MRKFFQIFIFLFGCATLLTSCSSLNNSDENLSQTLPDSLSIIPSNFRNHPERIHLESNLLVTHQLIEGRNKLMFSFNLQSPNSNYVLKSGEQIQVNPDGWSELKSIPIRSNLENCFNPIISSLGREVYFLGKTDSVNHLFRISKRDNLYHVFDSTFNEFANITLPVWGEPEKLSFDIPKGHWIVDFAGPKDDFAQFLLLGNKDDTLLYNVKLNWEDDYNKYKFELMRFDDPSGNTFDLKPYLSSIDNIYLGSGYLCFDKWGQIYFSKRGKSTWSWPKKIEVAGFKKNSRLIGFEVSSQDYYTTYLYFHAIDSAGNLGIKHIKKP